MQEPDVGSISVESLPRLVAQVTSTEPDRTVTLAGTTLAYSALQRELDALDRATGGALPPASLVPVVLNTLVPGLAESTNDAGLAGAIATLVADVAAVVSVTPMDDPATLYALYAKQAVRSPDPIAIEFEGETLTYGEFDARVNQLARYLISLGVEPESLVGLGMRRSFELLVAMYAIAAAGGAYVPLDPDHPADRIRHVLDAARPVAVLTTASTGIALPDDVRVVAVDEADVSSFSTAPVTDADRLAPLRAENLAYVIFTSGSTGLPKGVGVAHSAIISNLRWRQRAYKFVPEDRVVQKTPFTFDVSIWEFFWPLQAGARIVVARPDGHQDPAYLVELIARHEVTVAHFVPSMLAVYLSEPAAATVESLRYVFASGEALPAQTAARFHATNAAQLHNLYGPTEAAVDVTHYRTVVGEETIPIGTAVSDTDLLVLDDALRPTPPGVPGELYLAGPQLARGYVGRPDLTADRFVADPNGRPGSRMYRTGDLVRWRNDGQLLYIGRIDFQVKLRGLRIELGEIEYVLAARDDVAQVVVTVYADPVVGDALVGYVVAVGGVELDTEALTETARKSLPDYMVPAIFVQLDRFPLNTSGKLDRKALPAPDFAAARREYRAPATATETDLVAIFGALLGIDEIGADDDFFTLGGNSLLATRAVARVNAQFGTRIAVRDFFDAPTVGELAVVVDAAGGETAQAQPTLGPRPRPEHVPLAYAQRSMWFINRFQPESAAYNLPIAIRLSGSLDRSALRAAVTDLLERHESLRTMYPAVDGVGYQRIERVDAVSPDLDPVAVDEVTLASRVIELVSAPFDVTAQVPLRIALLRKRADEHVLVVAVHHISADGFSIGPLARDLMSAYAARVAGESPVWSPLAVQFADYTLWQLQALGSPEDRESPISQQLHYWVDTLHGLPDVLALPTDRPRPVVSTNRGANVDFTISGETAAGLSEIARVHGVTLFMVLHAALATVLARISATSDIAIGTPVAGRGAEELDDVIGMFVNTLVLRTQIDSDRSFRATLRQVREIDLAAFSNADVPFARVIEEMNPVRSESHSPLFQVQLAYQNLEHTRFELPNLVISALDLELPVTQFDLDFVFVDREPDGAQGGLDCRLAYATDLFEAASARRIGDALLAVLESIVGGELDRPVGDLRLLSAVEESEILRGWNGTDVAVHEDTLVDLFDAQVRRVPERTALVYAGATTTYGDLGAQVRRLARWLIDQGVGPDSLVGVAMPRSPELVIAVYATLAAGGAWVSMDPEQPIDRLRYMVAVSAPDLVLTTTAAEPDLGDVRRACIDSLDVADRSPSPVGDGDRRAALRPDHLAYVMFTSGSTGRPKGVAITHRAAVNQMAWMVGYFEVDENDVVLQKTPVTFDVSVWELLLPLQVGARLVVAGPDAHRDPDELMRLVRDESVTIFELVPSLLEVFAADPGFVPPPSLRYLISGGEELPGALAERIAARWDVVLDNAYGPTEVTIGATAHRCKPGWSGPVPIGPPVWNTRAYVLDARLRPVPVGVPGELYLAGVQLARGYVGRSDLTADRFVADPFANSGKRLYRTGDLVRWNSDGELHYLGRTDFQVKVRGLRIELGEIESVLRTQGSVASAVVVAHTDPALGEQLVGYVVPVSGAVVDVADLRAAVAAELPTYMVPALFLVLDELPLTPNGKLDRRALPKPVFESSSSRAPATPIEEIIAGVYADVLRLDRVGADDDFFGIGGNSLIAMQVVARLSAALDTTVTVRQVFEAPTVAMLATRVEAGTGSGGRIALTPRPRPDRIPLSLAQQRMWFLNRFSPESAAYNLPVVIRLRGALDREALAAAVADVVRRHEVLRTVYPDTPDGPMQVVLPVAEAQLDLLPVTVDPAELISAVRDFLSGGFDVTTEIPLRARVFALAPDEHVLAVAIHHVSADGSSEAPLTRDVAVAYVSRIAGEAPNWQPLPVQYADYTLWQREVLGSEDDPDSLISKQLQFWVDQLSGLPDRLELPTDRARPPAQSFAGATVPFSIGADLHGRLVELARRANCTLFMVVHAAFAALLSRLSGTTDIAVGTPIAGRGEIELDDLIGMFVNTLVLRAVVEPATRSPRYSAGFATPTSRRSHTPTCRSSDWSR